MRGKKTLGSFAKLRKETISFIMFAVRPSIHMELFGSHWTDFDEIWYLSFVKNLSRKFQFY